MRLGAAFTVLSASADFSVDVRGDRSDSCGEPSARCSSPSRAPRPRARPSASPPACWCWRPAPPPAALGLLPLGRRRGAPELPRGGRSPRRKRRPRHCLLPRGRPGRSWVISLGGGPRSPLALMFVFSYLVCGGGPQLFSLAVGVGRRVSAWRRPHTGPRRPRARRPCGARVRSADAFMAATSARDLSSRASGGTGR